MSSTYQVGALSSSLSSGVSIKSEGSSFEKLFKTKPVGNKDGVAAIFPPAAALTPKAMKPVQKKLKKLDSTEAAQKFAPGAETRIMGAAGRKKTKSSKGKVKKDIQGDDAVQTSKSLNSRQNDDKTVFVGNLPAVLDSNDIRNYFGKFGKIKAVRIRRKEEKETDDEEERPAVKRAKIDPSRKSIRAYVEFDTEKMAQDALQMNGKFICGFHIRVDSAKPRHNHKLSIFIGNVSYDALEEDVRKHFNVCGVITSVRLVRDNETDTPKGFGYVTFENAESIELALKLSKPLLGRVVRVQRSLEDTKNKQAALKSQKRQYLQTKRIKLEKEAKLKLKKSTGKKKVEVEIKPNGQEWQGEKATKTKSRKQTLKKKPGKGTSKIGKKFKPKKSAIKKGATN